MLPHLADKLLSQEAEEATLQVTMESVPAANLWGNCAGSFVDWQPLPSALYVVGLSLSIWETLNKGHLQDIESVLRNPLSGSNSISMAEEIMCYRQVSIILRILDHMH
jgi:hypothetical protein